MPKKSFYMGKRVLKKISFRFYYSIFQVLRSTEIEGTWLAVLPHVIITTPYC